MAMGGGGGGGGLSSDINVTPMIDVLLVLLIIFMITLPLSRRDFDVQVPPEQKQQPKQKQQSSDQIVLELLPDGSYAINRQPVPFAGLEDPISIGCSYLEAKGLLVEIGAPRWIGRKQRQLPDGAHLPHGGCSRRGHRPMVRRSGCLTRRW